MSKYKKISFSKIIFVLSIGLISYSSFAVIDFKRWDNANQLVNKNNIFYDQLFIAQEYDPRRTSSNTSLCENTQVEFGWKKNIKDRCQKKSIEQYIYWLTKSTSHENTFPNDPARTHLLAQAQTELANNYRDGYGVKKDYAKAIKWYNTAIKNRSDDAKIALAEMYKLGQGVKLIISKPKSFI